MLNTAKATIIQVYCECSVSIRSEQKGSPHFAIICSGSVLVGRNSDEVLEFQFWNGKGVLTFVGGAAMTNWNFLRTAPTGPRIPIDEAAFPSVEAFALSLTHL
jgi:hypothetical protein